MWKGCNELIHLSFEVVNFSIILLISEMVGSTLSHYRVIEKLGEGGMGAVYKAEDLKLRRKVAIKILPSFITASQEERTRFIQEAQLTSALNHPNILTVYEFDEVDDTAFLVTECIEGDTLSSLIKEGGLPIPQVLDIAIQIADGLSEAHRHGIVHRDIKPDNVMITATGQVKIMDFGLARLVGSSHVTTPGSLVGTFAYMSPEQINEEEIDERSDIFSFGVLLYQIITGKLPFEGKTIAEMLNTIIKREPTPVSKLRNDVPIALENIVMKALEKDITKRYQKVSELKQDIQDFIDNPSRKVLSQRATKTVKWLAPLFSLIIISFLVYYIWFPIKVELNTTAEKSIAVLPFKNITNDSTVDFLSLGLADYIITRLTYIHSILVKPTSAVSIYENQIVDVVQVGNELNTDFVLEGRYHKIDNRLLVSTQLVDVKTKNILWADNVNLRWEDIGKIQESISERIVEALEIKLTEAEKAELMKARTTNPEAFEYYLRGISLTRKGSRENNELAMKMLEYAISLDNKFAEAYAVLSYTYVEQFWSNYSSDTSWVKKGELAARKALELDPNLGLAFSSLGFSLRVQGKYKEGILTAIKALKIDPNDLLALDDIIEFYRHIGNFEKAFEVTERARKIDPTYVYRIRARIFQFMGRYQESIAEIKRAIQRSPRDAWLRGGLLAFSYIHLNDLQKAEEAIREAEKIDPNKPEIFISRAMLATVKGDFTTAEVELNSIKEYITKDYALARHAAAIYAKQNKVELALQWIKKSIELGNRWYSWYMTDTWFESIRNNTRFQEMMTQIKSELDSIAVELVKNNL